jgi:type II restriction enzyme
VLLQCDVSGAVGYTSQPQISRVLSEKWFQENGYCLSCDSDRLSQTPANTKASDFVCPACNESYELKTFRSRPVRTLVDGAYSALMSRIQSESVPTLMLLERNEKWQIQGLTAIHHLFLTPEVIEKRKPLSPSARRAGWVGCNIRLDLIVPDAQIEVVHQRNPASREFVRDRFRQFSRLKNIPLYSRGWANLTLRIVRSLKRSEFSLSEIYDKENLFAASYPDNRNIRAKMRQQLQVLRDLGYLEFCGGGRYRLLI